MQRDTISIPVSVGRTHFGRLLRSSRSVQVRVLDQSREVDGFLATSPGILCRALQPILRHLAGEELILTAVEEPRIGFGLGPRRLQQRLSDLDSAIAFLSEQ